MANRFADLRWEKRPVRDSTLLFDIINPPGDAELGNWMVAERVRWDAWADLIAAAPDLYAACARVLSAVQDGDEMAAVDICRAALAKARGE